MNIESLRAIAREFQSPRGAFPSIAHLPSGPVKDENAFVTALAVELLSRWIWDGAIANACRRACEFLLRSERRSQPGAFGFYPVDAQPAWMGEFLPADADDTALCPIAMYRAGAWPSARLPGQVELLDRYRLRKRPPGAEWFRAGIYPTWLGSGLSRNPIDACVNINVLTLIALSGVDEQHGAGIVEMAQAGLDWAQGDGERLGAIIPYYPHPGEFVRALRRAAEAGIAAAGMLRDRVRNQFLEGCEDSPDAPVCGSLGGGVLWTSPALGRLRALAGEGTPLPVV